ncbi:Uracil-regulated protein 1 [Batrachochytrium dendrobatidis]|nr:Uracil-regulated protein 1 [Batrachochytrium dendrobatidis]KAK5667054.1 Uracil-regulated protein 1 [Batrachochytrium dendrobatidis]
MADSCSGNEQTNVLKSILETVQSLKQDQLDLSSRLNSFQHETQSALLSLQSQASLHASTGFSPHLNASHLSSPTRKSLDMSFKVYSSGMSESAVESDSDADTAAANKTYKAMTTTAVTKMPTTAGKLPQNATSPGTSSVQPLYNHRIVLTTYPGQVGINPISLQWGATEPLVRGPIVASRHHGSLTMRNAIGAHGGAYSIYRALAVAIGDLEPNYKPNLVHTEPVVNIGPFPSWSDPHRIVSMDPWGHAVQEVFKAQIEKGIDVRPTIAITKAHMQLAEIESLVKSGSLKVDGKVVLDDRGQLMVVKAAVEPVWFLPGIAERFKCDETTLRRCLFEDTGGMYPELITRPDLKVFLPPIGGLSIYIFGNPQFISDPTKHLTLRVHDECNGSDVFGSDICTCRPYLIYGIEEAIRAAQTDNGVGVIVYFRKEGRALGEVTKYLVYNARKRAEGGDTAANYFQRTEDVAGVKDMRFQATMPDVLHWLGIQKIDRMISMSNMKYDAIVGSGIPIVERVEIPASMLPPDSQVEIDAKIASGYFSSSKTTAALNLSHIKGRTWDDISH